MKRSDLKGKTIKSVRQVRQAAMNILHITFTDGTFVTLEADTTFGNGMSLPTAWSEMMCGRRHW